MKITDKQFFRNCAFVAFVALVALMFIFLAKCNAEKVEAQVESFVEENEDSDAQFIAQVLYNECRFLPKLDQSAVVWVILNRVDSEERYFPDTIQEVVTQPNQFIYSVGTPVKEELYELAIDVLGRWEREKSGETDVGRTLPSDYCYFWGDGRKNYFTKSYRAQEYWNWSLPDPYNGE